MSDDGYRVKRVRTTRGAPELTHGKRVARDRGIVAFVAQRIGAELSSGCTYAQARARAIRAAADHFYKDDRRIRETWRRYEPCDVECRRFEALCARLAQIAAQSHGD